MMGQFSKNMPINIFSIANSMEFEKKFSAQKVPKSSEKKLNEMRSCVFHSIISIILLRKILKIYMISPAIAPPKGYLWIVNSKFSWMDSDNRAFSLDLSTKSRGKPFYIPRFNHNERVCLGYSFEVDSFCSGAKPFSIINSR